MAHTALRTDATCLCAPNRARLDQTFLWRFCLFFIPLPRVKTRGYDGKLLRSLGGQFIQRLAVKIWRAVLIMLEENRAMRFIYLRINLLCGNCARWFRRGKSLHPSTSGKGEWQGRRRSATPSLVPPGVSPG